MPMSRRLLQTREDFEQWAIEQKNATGDHSETWQHWFGPEVPRYYPAVVVYFWVEHAGLITDFWLEYVYPQDFPPSTTTPDPSTKSVKTDASEDTAPAVTEPHPFATDIGL